MTKSSRNRRKERRELKSGTGVVTHSIITSNAKMKPVYQDLINILDSDIKEMERKLGLKVTLHKNL